MGIAFEMSAVLRFGEPPLLGLAFTFPPACRLGAVRLMAEVPSIREKHTSAMQALARVGRRRHGARQENPTTVASQPEVQDPSPGTSEEDPGRRKKKSVERFEENPPPDTRFSNCQNHTDFILPSATISMPVESSGILSSTTMQAARPRRMPMS